MNQPYRLGGTQIHQPPQLQLPSDELYFQQEFVEKVVQLPLTRQEPLLFSPVQNPLSQHYLLAHPHALKQCRISYEQGLDNHAIGMTHLQARKIVHGNQPLFPLV